MVSAVLFLSFGVSCLLARLGQPFFVCHQHLWFGLSLPQAFVVCSFFLCHRHLCTVSFFHGLFCCKHSCQAFCLCLVSICFRVSLFLVSRCVLAARQLHPAWRFKLEFFPSRLPCGQRYKFSSEFCSEYPIWYSAIKFTKLHTAKCSLHEWA